jgi:hypothetical protein
VALYLCLLGLGISWWRCPVIGQAPRGIPSPCQPTTDEKSTTYVRAVQCDAVWLRATPPSVIRSKFSSELPVSQIWSQVGENDRTDRTDTQPTVLRFVRTSVYALLWYRYCLYWTNAIHQGINLLYCATVMETLLSDPNQLTTQIRRRMAVRETAVTFLKLYAASSPRSSRLRPRVVKRVVARHHERFTTVIIKLINLSCLLVGPFRFLIIIIIGPSAIMTR